MKATAILCSALTGSATIAMTPAFGGDASKPTGKTVISGSESRSQMLNDLIYAFDPYEDYPWRMALQESYSDGARIISYLTALPLAWREDGSFDFTLLDELTDEIFKLAPEARLLPRVFLTTPDWWDAAHPDQLLKFDGPRPCAPTYSRMHQKLWKYELKMYHDTRNASIASPLWRRDAGRAVAAYTRHLIKKYGRSHVEGIQLAYGTCGEWGPFGSYPLGQFGNGDFSAPMVEAFRAFRREKYGDDGRNDALPPGKVERMQVEYGMLRSPRSIQNVLDYYECASREQAESIRHFAHEVKAVDPTLAVGSFGAGLMAAGSSAYQLHNVPAATFFSKFLEIKELDFISTPNCYFNRQRGTFSQAPVYAVSRQKIFVAECDARTHHAKDIYSPEASDPRNQFMSEIGFNLATGSGRLWLYDFGKHWYRDESVRDVIRAVTKRYSGLIHEIPPSEIAVVVDPQSVPCSEGSMGFYRQFVRFLYDELNRCGAPSDHIVMADVFTTKPYKLYIFRDKFLTTPQEAKKIREFLSQNGASAIWFGPAGCVTPDGIDFAKSSQLTTFDIVPVKGAAGSNTVTLLDINDPLLNGMKLPLTGAGVEDLNGVYAPLLTASGGKVLGLVESTGLPGILIHDEGRRFDLWSASPLLPKQFIANLCEKIGIRRRVDGCGATLYGAGKLFTVRSDANQKLTIKSTAPRLTEIVTGKRYEVTGGQTQIPVSKGETLILLEE